MSLGSFIFGIIILAGGVVFIRYNPQVADTFGGGPGSYDRYKFAALLICIIGLIVMSGLHILILTWLVTLIFPALGS